MSISLRKQPHKPDRRNFFGGSDARIIMGRDEKALLRLRREKRGEAAALDLSGVLVVQLGLPPRILIDADMSSTLATGWVTSSATRSTGRSHCSINIYGQA